MAEGSLSAVEGAVRKNMMRDARDGNGRKILPLSLGGLAQGVESA